MRHAKLADIQSDRRHPSSRFKILCTTFEDCDKIDDKTMEVYGETFPEITEPCDESPCGQCEYNSYADPETCIWCGRKT